MSLEDRRPLLNTDQQIEHLKNKGITFDKVCEDEAKQYLSQSNNLFKLSSYRKNYNKHTEGENVGKYIHLDFAYLCDLAIIDMKLRYTIVQLALDIEHYTKLEILRIAEKNNEDGYTICSEYIKSLDEKQYNILRSELKRCASSDYCKDLSEKYDLTLAENKDEFVLENLPIWVFLEVIPFGRLVGFYGYYASKLKNKKMLETSYILRTCKEIRNACAHSNCILNDLRPNTVTHNTSHSISKDISNIEGISSGFRSKKMSNIRIQQIITLLYEHKMIVTSNGVHRKASNLLHELLNRISKNISYYESNDLITTSFNFLNIIIDKWFIKS